jgi:hypothetical protein
MARKALAGTALGLSLLQAGCIELTKEVAYRENGEARVEVEMALSAELVALASDPAFGKLAGSEGLPNLFGDCGKPWPANEPLPDGVRSVESRRGKRGDMETCTIVLDVVDPVVALESARKVEVPSVENMPKQDASLTRLEGSPGYRLRVVMSPAQSPDLPPEAVRMAAVLMKAMFADRYVTLHISGQRIENTNGELSSDRRRATWRLPLADLVTPGADKPVTIEADVIYR